MPRYILYARKSTESEDRQVLSIDSQIRELQDLARSQSLKVTAVLSEARSAKSPGRQVFGDLLRELARGRADGILCWKLDRLARNPVDGGALIWAVDENKLSQIVTPQRTFVNTGNDKFWMQLEFGMAKKYVDDLSDNVRRGNRAKLELGGFPGLPPVGYMNDRATRSIVVDPDRFQLVRKIWDEILAGTPPPKVFRMVNEDWGFRTRKFKRIGNCPLASSSFYKLLANPFYYGLIVRKEGSFPGVHKHMISKDEFDKVQELLGRPQRPHLEKHEFAFTGLIRCGECGSAITAEHKVNRQGHRYVYYHCTKRRRDHSCQQRVIQVQDLERQIAEVLEHIRIEEDFHAWSMEWLRTVHADETSVRAAMDRSLHAAYLECQKKLDALTDLRIRGLLTDDEYAKKREGLLGEQLRLKEQLEDTDGRATRWRELTERAFLFSREAKERFETGTLEDKREILVALGSNLVLRDKKLRIQLEKPLLFIQESLPALRSEKRPFEPLETCLPIHKNDGREAVIPVWCGLVDRVRTFFATAPDTIVWPKFCVQAEAE